MRRLVVSVGAIMLLALTPLSVSGQEGSERRIVRANLTGFQEVPANSTAGHGQFVARLGEISLEFELTYADMEDTVFVAHVHLAQRSVDGGIMFFLCGGGGRPDCTSPSGSFSGTVTAADVVGPAGQGISPGEFQEVLRALRSGSHAAESPTLANDARLEIC